MVAAHGGKVGHAHVALAAFVNEGHAGQPGVVTEESKPTTSLSPLLYDLTSLQREGNSRFGFSAKNTLGLAQALYENIVDWGQGTEHTHVEILRQFRELGREDIAEGLTNRSIYDFEMVKEMAG